VDQKLLAQEIAVIVAALYKTGGLSAEAIARKNYLGRRDTDDTLADLIGRGVVQKLPNGDFDLTGAGMQLRESIGKRWKDFQDSETAGLSQADIRVAKDVLGKLLENADFQ
jgi:DNA-binding MarR family transcriptional regulator